MSERTAPDMPIGECIAPPVGVFRGRALPRAAVLAGYAWLIDRHELELPLPPRLAAIAGRHRPREEGGWLLLPERYRPADDLAAQLTFALKWEGVDLAVLDTLFAAVPPERVAEAVRQAPTSAYMRRVWFLHEWLTGRRLDLPDAGKVRAVEVVDPELQVALPAGEISRRHRVRDNLPGTRAFCPMVRRTPAIRAAQAAGLAGQARRVIGRTPADVLARAAAFLLLADSRASYRIEGETPSPERALRWAQAIARAGATRLSVEEMIALQRLVIGDARFVHIGLRTEGGFVGEHDRLTGAPIPDHVSARAEDLPSLVGGLVAYDERAIAGRLDPVVAAAVAAFGFVYVHPFEDGNGRIHRWLVHHVLAAGGFTPRDVVFPVSAVMLREIGSYRAVLESYSRPLLPLIRWRATEHGNVEVLNDTARWYRFFDATRHAEFLYACVATTVRVDLPYEVAYLEAYDRFAESIATVVEMPARTVDLLHRFLRQNGGRLSQRARSREFSALTDQEVARVEALYADFAASLPSPAPGEDAGTAGTEPQTA
ncbi:MAG TPA: Fic family protein [Gemmatimonadaceae bacterium]|nr:Fic family protein [Gemmatimonadaceae bacterium]